MRKGSRRKKQEDKVCDVYLYDKAMARGEGRTEKHNDANKRRPKRPDLCALFEEVGRD
jgi:hypothetical protein